MISINKNNFLSGLKKIATTSKQLTKLNNFNIMFLLLIFIFNLSENMLIKSGQTEVGANPIFILISSIFGILFFLLTFSFSIFLENKNILIGLKSLIKPKGFLCVLFSSLLIASPLLLIPREFNIENGYISEEAMIEYAYNNATVLLTIFTLVAFFFFVSVVSYYVYTCKNNYNNLFESFKLSFLGIIKNVTFLIPLFISVILLLILKTELNIYIENFFASQFVSSLFSYVIFYIVFAFMHSIFNDYETDKI